MDRPFRPQPHTTLLVMLALLIIVADQLSKAWFVYHLGSHKPLEFLAFCREYFTLWAGWQLHADGAVISHYFPAAIPSEVLVPPHWVEWHLVTNSGAAWSMFSGNSFALSGVSLIMATALAIVWGRHFRFNLPMTWAFGAIIGGALGNFADRFRLHEVVDFISVKIPFIARWFPSLGSDPYQFPIFNVADACAVCGTLGLALYLIVTDIQHMRRKRKPQPAPAPYHDPTELSDAEKAAKIAALTELAASVRSGEQFTPRSRTDLPLGLDRERGTGPFRQSDPLDEEPNDKFTSDWDSSSSTGSGTEPPR
jgi:signal peptidase II